ncbi:hypothetical protein V5N11_029615 [Cardamine amara subsp. amara]|uniref:Uncharacterized protein n=1 Tax=Cardamine amara subsp. amara TaxID=228776 RepID=A0ABD1BAV0_CARAN
MNNQNQGGYSNFGQRNNFSGNQNSTGYVSKPQYSKPFTSNNSYGRTYGSSSYQAPPAQTETSEIKAKLKQVLEGQQKITVDFNGKIDALYTYLNSKVEALNTHVKKLDTQVAQTAGAMIRQDRTLPGRTDANPKYQCSALTLRRCKELNPILRRSLNAEKIADLEKIETDFEDGIHATGNTIGLCRDLPVLIDEDELVDVEESEVEKHEKSEDSNKSKNLANDKNESVLVNTYTRNGRDAEAASKQKSEEQQNPTERVYKPKIPFPMNPRKSKQELYEAKCRAILKKLTMEIHLMDAIKTTLVVKSCLKRMLTTYMVFMGF